MRAAEEFELPHRAFAPSRLSLVRVCYAALVIGAPVLIGVIVASCGDAGSPLADRPRYGVRDSAGIRIAENPRPEPDSRLGWTVGTESLVSIGSAVATTDFQLHGVGDATRLADGRIVVANGGSMELLVFDAEGNFLDAWAGQGDGPGEFSSISTVRPWQGDSLIAGDSQQGRVSIFDQAGAHGRTMSLRGPPDPSTRERAAAVEAAGVEPVDIEPHIVLRVLRDGTLLTRTPRGYAGGFHRWESAYALMDADGSTRTSLGTYLGIETFSAFYEQDERTVAVIPLRHPFGKATLTTAWGNLAVIGDNETYEIRAYHSDGSLARIVRRDHETRIPTQAEQDEAFRNRFAGLSEEDREPRMAVAADVPLVESFPAFSRLRGDALGYLWVSEFKLPDAAYEGTLWNVFDSEGRVLGFVETPDALSIFEIGENYILAKVTDDLGVEYVRLWGLTRPQ